MQILSLMGPVSHRFHYDKLYECSRYHSPLLAFSHTPDRETLQQKQLNLQGQLGLPGAQRWPPRGRQKYVLLFSPSFRPCLGFQEEIHCSRRSRSAKG